MRAAPGYCFEALAELTRDAWMAERLLVVRTCSYVLVDCIVSRFYKRAALIATSGGGRKSVAQSEQQDI